ncbi:50S ribosomal protein L4, partial [uncultured Muribaculum sp.]
VFGPRPRDYRFKLNKKLKALARRSALTYKAQDNQIIVVEDFNFEAPKTKEFVNFTKNLQLADKKVLLVLKDQNKNVYLSARNVPGAQIITASDVNTYSLLNNKAIILTEGSLEVINNL